MSSTSTVKEVDTFDIKIRPGISRNIGFEYTDKDDVAIPITDANIRSQIKLCIDDNDGIVDWSTGNGSFIITDGANGMFALSLTASQTEALRDILPDVSYYDIELELTTGEVRYIVGGKVLKLTTVTSDDSI